MTLMHLALLIRAAAPTASGRRRLVRPSALTDALMAAGYLQRAASGLTITAAGRERAMQAMVNDRVAQRRMARANAEMRT